jgi:hypothetical protein
MRLLSFPESLRSQPVTLGILGVRGRGDDCPDSFSGPTVGGTGSLGLRFKIRLFA